MDVYRTEEEQVEALKRWWQENGKSILIGIVLALTAVYGYKGWENHRQTQGEAASNLYFDLLDAVAVSEESDDEVNRSTIAHLTNQIKTEHEGSNYAVYAALLSAKQAVAAKDLVLAEQELQWALERSDADSSLHLITRLRLARVVFAQDAENSAQRALGLIETTEAGSHTASYEEVKGDFYLSMERIEDARQAYSKALAEVEAGGGQRPLLTIKLNDLAQDGES